MILNWRGEFVSGNILAVIETTLLSLDNSNLLKFIVGNIVENEVDKIDSYFDTIVLDIFCLEF